MIRSIIAFLGIAVVTVVYSVAVMLHMALFRDRDVFFIYARSWSRWLLRLAGIRVQLSGSEHVQPGQRYIYVANHASLFDIPVLLATVPDNIRIMYKRELASIPVFGWGLRMSPFIAVDRDNSREAAAQIEQAVQSMRSGSSVVVFPEGTRSADGSVGDFKRGAFTLAARAGRPLVPVALVGTATVMPARTWRLKGGTVRCIVLPPVELPKDMPSRADERRAMEHVHARIAEHVSA